MQRSAIESSVVEMNDDIVHYSRFNMRIVDFGNGVFPKDGRNGRLLHKHTKHRTIGMIRFQMKIE